MEELKKVMFNPLIVYAKKVAHWFIYMYDYMEFSRELVDEKLNKIFKCYADKDYFKTTVLVQIIAERKNLNTGWTSFDKIEKDFFEVRRKLNELLKNESK